jgi:uncharacterized membrane protein YqaE (UPF0057 family)
MWLFVFIFPPLAVAMTEKWGQVLVNCILTFCGWLPGIIHAAIIVSQYNSDKRSAKTERLLEAQLDLMQKQQRDKDKD